MVNEEIKEAEVRLIDEEGTLIGLMSSNEALQIAYQKNLDMVMIAPTAKPPVCKIMDYNKYVFDMAKKEREKLFAQLHGLPYVDDTPVVEEETEEVTDETTETPAEEVVEAPVDTEYVPTKYTTTSGSVVRVEYEGGVNFILNYNSFAITVKYNGRTYEIPALGFVRFK